MSAWSKSGFVAEPADADPTVIKTLGLFDQLIVQTAVGTRTRSPAVSMAAWITRCLEINLQVASWAWCDGQDVAGEARAHARVLEELRLRRFGANIEEAYDAHGNSSSPRYRMPTLYLVELQAELNRLAWKLDAIAVTTTPRFGSDMTAWVAAGATVMPQAFPLENHATVLETVEHARAWGWPTDRIRPLVQTYDLWVEKTNGGDGQPVILSVWELSDADRTAVASGATIELRTWGTGTPPISLSIGPSMEERRS